MSQILFLNSLFCSRRRIIYLMILRRKLLLIGIYCLLNFLFFSPFAISFIRFYFFVLAKYCTHNISQTIRGLNLKFFFIFIFCRVISFYIRKALFCRLYFRFLFAFLKILRTCLVLLRSIFCDYMWLIKLLTSGLSFVIFLLFL